MPATTVKEKTAKAYGEHVFRFESIYHDIQGYFKPVDPPAQPPPPANDGDANDQAGQADPVVQAPQPASRWKINISVIQADVLELADRWQAVTSAFLAYRDARDPNDLNENVQIQQIPLRV